MSIFLIQLSIYITNTFSPEAMILFCIFLLSLSVLYLNIKGIPYKEVLSVNCPNNIKGVIVISLSVAIATVASQVIKYIVKVPRPETMLVLENGYSFPSAHTTLVFAFCSAVIFMLFKYFKDHNRTYLSYLHAILFISIAVLVGFTRLTLQVHRPIDVIAGFVLGLASTYASIKIYYTITRYVDFKTFK